MNRIRLLFCCFLSLILLMGLIPNVARSQGDAATPTGVPCTVEIIRDEESLTVYIGGNRCVSIAGLAFEVALEDGVVKTYRLEEYSSFKGLPFANLPVPICFRLVVRDARGGFPSDCLNGVRSNRRLSHTVSEADVFWFNKDAAQGTLLNVLRFGVLLDICPAGQPRCVLEVPPAPPTQTPLPTDTMPPAPRTITPLPSVADMVSGIFEGTWTGSFNDVFQCKFTLQVDQSNNITGNIVWTIVSSSRSVYRNKIGLSAIEYIVGTFQPASKTFSFKGIRKDDPNSIMELDQYELTISTDLNLITGKTFDHGRWTGQITARRI